MTNTSPSTLFPGTQWAEIGSGRALMGADSSHAVGTTAEAGLPNITGQIDSRPHTSGNAAIGGGVVGRYASGVFSFKPHTSSAEEAGTAESSTHTKGDMIHFDASKSSSIYGNSTTVQPPAFYIKAWKRTA